MNICVYVTREGNIRNVKQINTRIPPNKPFKLMPRSHVVSVNLGMGQSIIFAPIADGIFAQFIRPLDPLSTFGEIMEELTYDNATHLLKCAHAIGTSRLSYTMRCHILGITKSRMYKILVFGDRYWKHKEHRKKIRYVPKWRLIKRST